MSTNRDKALFYAYLILIIAFFLFPLITLLVCVIASAVCLAIEYRSVGLPRDGFTGEIVYEQIVFNYIGFFVSWLVWVFERFDSE